MRFVCNKAFLISLFVILAFSMTGCTLQKKTTSDASANTDPIIITEDALNASANRGN